MDTTHNIPASAHMIHQKNNGTLKWKFKTGIQIESSPAIAEDGTIYMEFCDDYLYAIGSKIRKGEEL
jgi:outer membrane protein assembly factor BamB